MNTVRLGPFSSAHINQIKEQIDRLGHTYKIEVDQDLLKQYQDKISARNYYESASAVERLGEYFFIEVNNESYMAIKKILNDLGMLPDNNATYLEDIELFCPKCDYMATQDGYCPEHHLKLIDYFSKTKSKNEIIEKRSKILMQIFIVAIVMMLALTFKSFVAPLLKLDLKATEQK